MINFIETTPETIPVQSLAYLQNAADTMEGYCTVNMAMDQVRDGSGAFYNVLDNMKLVGCMFINYRTVPLGKTMNLVLLGGENIKSWAKELTDFVHVVAKQRDIDEFTVLGRIGFARLFPDLEPLAYLLRKKMK